MKRKITQEEIDSLEEYNKTHPNKYVSVEAYQDILDWLPEPSKEDIEKILGDIS